MWSCRGAKCFHYRVSFFEMFKIFLMPSWNTKEVRQRTCMLALQFLLLWEAFIFYKPWRFLELFVFSRCCKFGKKLNSRISYQYGNVYMFRNWLESLGELIPNVVCFTFDWCWMAKTLLDWRNLSMNSKGVLRTSFTYSSACLQQIVGACVFSLLVDGYINQTQASTILVSEFLRQTNCHFSCGALEMVNKQKFFVSW